MSSLPQEGCTGYKGLSKDSQESQESTGAKNSKFAGSAIKGFPLSRKGNGVKWCQDLKTTCVSVERQTRRKDRNIVEYLGIAADEPKRFAQLNEKKRAPLVEFGIDEGLCGLYCQYANMLSPTYESSCRDGCWFCHNQGVAQLRALRKQYPDLWALLMKWDLDSPISFKADGHTVHDFDRRFEMEDKRLVPTDNTFRWDMLKKPPRFVSYEAEWPVSFFVSGGVYG